MREEIQLIGKHPHAGERGMIDGSGMPMNGGTMLLVELIECKHGTDRCYASPENIGRVTVTPLVSRRRQSLRRDRDG
jgi:hypothetical protein